jgi:hypothetical protein
MVTNWMENTPLATTRYLEILKNFFFRFSEKMFQSLFCQQVKPSKEILTEKQNNYKLIANFDNS